MNFVVDTIVFAIVFGVSASFLGMGNFGLNGGTPWITNTDDALCYVCKRDTETLGHFLFDRS